MRQSLHMITEHWGPRMLNKGRGCAKPARALSQSAQAAAELRSMHTSSSRLEGFLGPGAAAELSRRVEDHDQPINWMEPAA